MKEIIKKINNGEIERDNDESGTGGFWDLSYEILGKTFVDSDDEQELVERIYNSLWETYEATKETL